MIFDLAACNTEQLVLLFSRPFSTKFVGALGCTPNRAALYSYQTEILVTSGVLLTIANIINRLPHFQTQRSFNISGFQTRFDFFGLCQVRIYMI